MSTYAEIVTELVMAREYRGWSRREVSRQMGTDHDAHYMVSSWERGSSSPYGANLIRWANALGYDVELVPREES